jgi:uncharacterized protein
MPTIRFYEELNDYLPKDNRKQDIEISSQGTWTVRSILSSMEVPLSEVDLILVNGEPAGADQEIQIDDRISVYPVFERLNLKGVTQVRKRPLRRIKFITDSGLDDLTDRLSALGFDTVRMVSGFKGQILQRSEKEKRIILTMDRDIFRRGSVTRVIILSSSRTDRQVQEIRAYLDLDRLSKMCPE